MDRSYDRFMEVPILDLTAQHERIEPELMETVRDVISENAFIMGEELEQFESEFADFCDVDHCIGVSSGTDALRLALHAAGIGDGDEVITVPVTFIATVEAICSVGAEPVFVDVDPETYTMDPDQLEAAISDRTAALLPVHLYGQPADMDSICSVAEQHDLTVIEDACQAHGASWNETRVGGWGDLGCFSFYPGKNIGAPGDAGSVTTSDSDLASRVRTLRNHGQPEKAEKYQHEELGYNARLDNLHAATLRLKLQHLEQWNEQRRRNADRYDREFTGVSGIRIPKTAEGAEHVYHQYAVQVEERDEAQTFMGDRGIDCGVHYPRPLHYQEACSFLGYEKGDFPVSERICSRVLTLPCFPELTDGQQEHVVDALRAFLSG